MKHVQRTLTFIFLGTFFLATFLVPLSSKAHALPGAGSWRAGRIIDDQIFTNRGGMTVGSIQQFLNSKMPSCDTWGNKTTSGGVKRATYAASRGNPAPFTCLKDYYEVPKTQPGDYEPASNYGGAPIPPGAKSAAQLIWDAAQAHSISPQVLLITLQKEQGLITDDWPFKKQYLRATGAYCPDGPNGAQCDLKYAGFSIQVMEGAALLRRYLDNMTQSWWPYKKPFQNNNILWQDVNTKNCGSSAVYLESKATAALYTYTPYQPNQAALNAGYGTGDECSAYGNRNFWLYYNDWFGPTVGTKILKKDADPAFYLYSSGKKLRIPSFALYKAYGFDQIGVTQVTNEYLDGLSNGNDLSALARGNDGTVHLVSNSKRHILTGETCANWGVECTNPFVVNTLDDDMLDIPDYAGYVQPLMRNNGAIYKMVSGKRAPFLNVDALTQNGYNFAQITEVEDINARQPLGPLIPNNGVTFKPNNSSAIITYLNGSYIKAGSLGIFYDWGLDRSYYPTVPSSELDSQEPATSTTLSDRYVTHQSKTYLVDGGRKIDVTAAGANWPAGANLAYVGPLLERLAGIAATADTCFKTPDGAIFQVANSQRRLIKTFEDVYRLGCNPDTIVNLKNSLPMLGAGPDRLSLNRPFKKTGDDAIYITTGPAASKRIATYEHFMALGLSPEDVYDVSTATGAAYPANGNAESYGQRNGMYYIFSHTGVKYWGTKEILAEWGVSDLNPVYQGNIADRLPTEVSTRFAHTRSGAIYYASGGSKHLLTTYDAYSRLGGYPGNTMEVLDDFMDTLPTGSNIN